MPEQAIKLVLAFLNYKKVACEELSLHFVDKEKISSLHDLYFSDPSPTDCISFPIDSPKENPCVFLGEIFICPEVAIEQSQEFNTDPCFELSLYIIHGLLHLLEFDDIEEKEQKIMRQEEKAAIAMLMEKNILIKPRT
ncbi:MAG: rRNA maturation RNase YbeY [Simkaniaceae bacterium]